MEKQTYLCATGLSKKGKANLKKFLRQNLRRPRNLPLDYEAVLLWEQGIKFDWVGKNWKTDKQCWYGSFEVPACETKSGHTEVFTAKTCELFFVEFEAED